MNDLPHPRRDFEIVSTVRMHKNLIVSFLTSVGDFFDVY